MSAWRRLWASPCALYPQAPMDKASLRPLVLDALRKTPQTHLHAIETEIRRKTDEYERHDVLAVQEILWELLVQGVLAPGKNSLNLNLPFVHVTEFGAGCLEDGAIIIHDPEEYIARIESIFRDHADPDLIETTREALLAFLAGRYISSAVMLSRSIEHLLDRLASASIHHGRHTGHGVQRLEKARSCFPRLVPVLCRALGSWGLPSELAGDMDGTLSALGTVYDRSHTTGGRSRLPRIDRETAFAYLLLFPAQCRFVYDLIAHLEGTSSK